MKIIKIIIIIALCFYLKFLAAQTLGNDIKELMKETSVSELAKEVNIDRKTLRLYINDSIEPDLIIVHRLAIKLDGYVDRDLEDELRIIPRGYFLYSIRVRFIDMEQLTLCIAARDMLHARAKVKDSAFNIRKDCGVLFSVVSGKIESPTSRI